MSLNSMTGFGRGEARSDSGDEISVEIRSVNGRGLDIRFRGNARADRIEAELRETVRGRLSRGTVHVVMESRSTEPAASFRINEELLAMLVSRAETLHRDTGVSLPSADGLLAIRGVVEAVPGAGETSGEEADRHFDEALRRAFTEALDQLQAMRAEEGRALQAAIADHVSELRRLSQKARADESRSSEAIAARLCAQIGRLTEAGNGLDTERLYMEAALLATRADIAEDLDRIDAHCAAADALLQASEPAGRRLDFLAQEFGREANTLCAKAQGVALSQDGLQMKTIVDRLREQVQNIE